MKLKIIGNIMFILGWVILIFILVNPFEEVDKVFNFTLNAGLWLVIIGSLIRSTRKKRRKSL